MVKDLTKLTSEVPFNSNILWSYGKNETYMNKMTIFSPYIDKSIEGETDSSTAI